MYIQVKHTVIRWYTGFFSKKRKGMIWMKMKGISLFRCATPLTDREQCSLVLFGKEAATDTVTCHIPEARWCQSNSQRRDICFGTRVTWVYFCSSSLWAAPLIPCSHILHNYVTTMSSFVLLCSVCCISATLLIIFAPSLTFECCFEVLLEGLCTAHLDKAETPLVFMIHCTFSLQKSTVP